MRKATMQTLRLDSRARTGLVAALLAIALTALNTGAAWWKPGHLPALASGYLLVAALAFMWALPVARAISPALAAGLKRWHEAGGIVVLALFCWHAAAFRHNLLLWLGILILAGGALGALHPRVFTPYSERYARMWWSVHILLGCAITALALIHLYSSYAYRAY